MTAADASSAEVTRELKRITRRALVLRLFVAVSTHFLLGPFALAPDQETYDYVGGAVARFWSGESAFQTGFVQNARDAVAYYYIVGAIYFVFGQWPLIPKLVNCWIGSLMVPLIYHIAFGVSGDAKMALRSARYVAYFPSLVLWSALMLRDIWTACLILLVCRMALALQESPRISHLVLLGASVFLLTEFRGYIFLPVVVPIALSFVIRGRRHFGRNLLIGGIVGAAIIYVDSASAQRRFRLPDLATLQELRYFTSLGAQQYEAAADISTPIKALLFLPKGVTFFLLAPFPWEVRNAVQASTVPEMLFFYSLIPALFLGLKHLVRHRLADSLMMLLMVGTLTLGYALGQSNVGTAYRHRAQVLPFYLMLAGIGVELRRRSQVSTLRQPSPAAMRSLNA